MIAPIVSFHWGTPRAACLARMQAWADGYLQSSTTLFSMPMSVYPKKTSCPPSPSALIL